jgi:hypothetical protein
LIFWSISAKRTELCSTKGGALLVGALGGDDIAGRVGHVAKKRVEQIIF